MLSGAGRQFGRRKVIDIDDLHHLAIIVQQQRGFLLGEDAQRAARGHLPGHVECTDAAGLHAFHAQLALLEFGLRRGPDLDDRHATSELCDALVEHLPVVVAAGIGAFLLQRLDALPDALALPGASDDGAAADGQLAALQEAFEASAWADREPYDIEVPFETLIGDRLVRGRMDAVFRTEDGGFEVVDWKTGRAPSGEEASAAAVQLAAYRLAWAKLEGVEVERVGAAFHYVAANVTVRPADLLDEAGLVALLEGVPAG